MEVQGVKFQEHTSLEMKLMWGKNVPMYLHAT